MDDRIDYEFVVDRGPLSGTMRTNKYLTVPLTEPSERPDPDKKGANSTSLLGFKYQLPFTNEFFLHKFDHPDPPTSP